MARAAGTSVRVRLFSAIDLARADIAGTMVDPSSQTTEVSAQGGPLSVTAYGPGVTIQRHYDGIIRSATAHGEFILVNEVPLEAYVASVMASEISPGWHPEALKAQAVAVRTYALRRMRHPRSPFYDVVDDTSNQVYHGLDTIMPSHVAAASATVGQSLVFAGAPADIWYHSSCGGHTADSAELTGALSPAYLRGTPDVDGAGQAYCALSPYFSWRNSLTSADVARVAKVDATAVGSLTILDRWPDGRVRTLRARAADGATHDIDGHEFYSRAGAVLGYKVVPSAMFDVAATTPDSTFVFSGRGVGHGVGMCQWGAQGRAKGGASAAEILAAYFLGTTLSQTTP